MADPVEVRIRGVEELAAGTRELSGRIADAVPREFEHVAAQVASRVRGSVPRRSGRLAASVRSRGVHTGALVGMGDTVPYAQYVEYGGRGHPHNPRGNYLYPAAMDAEPLLVAAGTRAANREIEGMSWPSP